MTSGDRLLFRVRGSAPGPYELVLRAVGAGEQRFTEASLAALERAVGALAPFLVHRREDAPEALAVDGPALELVRHSGSLEVEVVAGAPGAEQLRDAKAARVAAERAAHAAVDYSTLLRGYPARVLRAESLAWLRATPVADWPPIRVTLAQDGTPILTDGNHRVAVAREFGVAALNSCVRAGGRVHEAPIGV